jgi:hypothetical protein
MPAHILRPLTETSWILTLNGDRIGLVSQLDGAVKLVGKNGSIVYATLEDLASALGGKLSIEQATDSSAEKEAGMIGSFPIKHNEWHNILHDPVPNYTRTIKSEHRYAAGYYGLRFPTGWTGSFCPKLLTLSEYEYMGPFTTKLEMQHQLSIKNKAINV